MSSLETDLTPPPYLSPSSIGTFQNCQLKFKYNKIDLIPDKPTQETMLGNFVHETLELFYAYDKHDRTLPLAKTLMSQAWNGYGDVEGWKDKISTLIQGEEKLRAFRWQAWWCIENLWKIEDPNVVEVSEIEHELNGSIGGVKMKGFIDRYLFDGNNITISDYKTGKTPKKQYVDDKFTQLIIYSSLLLDEMADRFIVRPDPTIELLYLKDGVRFSKKVKPDDIEEMTEGIQKTKKQIDHACKTGVFSINPTMLCNWCGYKTICPAWVK